MLKPMHFSVFFQTPLEILRYLGASSLIQTGLTTNRCIVGSAHDARVRNFKLYVRLAAARPAGTASMS